MSGYPESWRRRTIEEGSGDCRLASRNAEEARTGAEWGCVPVLRERYQCLGERPSSGAWIV